MEDLPAQVSTFMTLDVSYLSAAILSLFCLASSWQKQKDMNHEEVIASIWCRSLRSFKGAAFVNRSSVWTKQCTSPLSTHTNNSADTIMGPITRNSASASGIHGGCHPALDSGTKRLVNPSRRRKQPCLVPRDLLAPHVSCSPHEPFLYERS
jgi:hypothetical protein